MFTIEGIIDVVMPGGCKGWTSEAHRSLAARTCLRNKKVDTMDKLKEVCLIINSFDEKTMVSVEESLKNKGIIK